MAHVKTDQHGFHRVHLFRELHIVKISSHLGVDLLQYVRSLGQIELVGVPSCNDLAGDLVLLVQLLMLIVEGLVSENHHKHLWMLQHSTFTHEKLNFFLQFFDISLVVKLNPVRLGNSHSKFSLRIHKVVVNRVSSLEVVSAVTSCSSRFLVADDPLLVYELNRLLDF